MSEEKMESIAIDDIYAKKPFYAWIALIGGLLAWTFDGVEQGVYAIMSRAALKDLIPQIHDHVEQLNALMAQGAVNAQTQIAELTKVVDEEVGFYFGLAMAMWLWGAAIGGVLFGHLGDRMGRVKALIFAVITYSIFTGLSALTTHWWQFCSCRLLGSMGLGGAWPLSLALIVETWPERNRSVLSGLMGAGANVGFLIAAWYSGFMLELKESNPEAYAWINWRWVIGMGFFIGISSLLIIVFVPEPTKWKIAKAKKQHSSFKDLFAPRYRRAAIVGPLLSTVALLGTWGSFLWMSTFVDQIAQGTEFQETAKATMGRWQSVGQIAGGFLGGVLAVLMGGNKRSWVFLCIATWASVFSLFYFNTIFGYQMLFMAALAGIFVTAYFGWLPKYLSELFPTRIRALGQGFSFNFGRILTGFGVLGAGWLTKEVFEGDYRRTMMVMCTIYLTGLIVILFAPNTGMKLVSDEEDEAAIQRGDA
ncbi:MAG: MFS transporter [Candidatus Omnitrophica bacterium]|nr:MFS transporter [Candidatus Omnitrophota bacterium]